MQFHAYALKYALKSTPRQQQACCNQGSHEYQLSILWTRRILIIHSQTIKNSYVVNASEKSALPKTIFEVQNLSAPVKNIIFAA
eukprot:1140532-Pelagomonas_calceolata.AAC.5